MPHPDTKRLADVERELRRKEKALAEAAALLVLAVEPEATRAERTRDLAGHAVALFLEVDDLDAVERALAGVPVVKARHETFYGTSELYVREPGGTTVGFSMRLPGPPTPAAAASDP